MADPISISDFANLALDKAYNATAGRMLAQIQLLTNSPTSALQKALAELDQETTRLEEQHLPLGTDNAVLLKTLQVVERTFEATASLIQANDNKIQASGAAIAVPAVTAKVWLTLSNAAVLSGADPLSPVALAEYIAILRERGIIWRIP